MFGSMFPRGASIFIFLVAFSYFLPDVESVKGVRKFPDGFLFGAATASYQIEGGWDEDGKSENIWDYLVHNTPEAVKDMSNGDIADDSYHQYKRDVQMMRELGLDFYRFSLSWTRILPTSFPDKINEKGVQYYNNLIDEMLKYNIKPMVTLYHWDLPQKLQELGGWTNPYIVDWYTDFARVAFDKFGDRVKYWITINEPFEICHHGYGNPTFAPALNSSGLGEYMCSKNLLVAHAKTYHLYNEVYRPVQKGNISITMNSPWYEPETNDDIQTASEAHEFILGQYAHPIFSKNGDFPTAMKERIAAKSAEQGFLRSRLPEFTPYEVQMLLGSSDFFGMNHYSTFVAYRSSDTNYVVPSFFDDRGSELYQPSDWLSSASDRTKVVPWGFYKVLTYIREAYDNPPIFVTENGFPSLPGLNDDDRINYYRGYLNALLDAVEEGSNIIGYTAWSLMDNFEWASGYTVRYGIYEVDYDSPERTRTPRKSAFVYKEILRTRTLDPHYEPNTSAMTNYSCY